MQEIVAGIDLGGTGTKFGLVTHRGELIASNSVPTNSSLPYRTFFKKLYWKIVSLMKTVNRPLSLKGIGIGAPTGNFVEGSIGQAANLDWPDKVPVAEILSTVSNLPVVLVNDADAAAMGEKLYGAAKEMRNFIVITIGTGLGCGIVVNDKLVMGNSGRAGEIGHTTVYYDGRPCGCGRQGCLETYVSASGIIYTARELMKTTDIKSSLCDLDELDTKKITEAALQNDTLAIKTYAFTGNILGMKLADTIATLDPEAIIVAGGLAKAGAFILEPAKKSMENHLLNIYKNRINICTSSLMEENAAILGAAAVIWDKLEKILLK